jgi:hypothetical protein
VPAADGEREHHPVAGTDVDDLRARAPGNQEEVVEMIGVGLLVLRLVLGVIFIGHGAQKLFGSFGGLGLKGTAGFFEQVGIKPAYLMAVLAGLAEFVGGYW